MGRPLGTASPSLESLPPADHWEVGWAVRSQSLLSCHSVPVYFTVTRKQPSLTQEQGNPCTGVEPPRLGLGAFWKSPSPTVKDPVAGLEEGWGYSEPNSGLNSSRTYPHTPGTEPLAEDKQELSSSSASHSALAGDKAQGKTKWNLQAQPQNAQFCEI